MRYTEKYNNYKTLSCCRIARGQHTQILVGKQFALTVTQFTVWRALLAGWQQLFIRDGCILTCPGDKKDTHSRQGKKLMHQSVPDDDDDDDDDAPPGLDSSGSSSSRKCSSVSKAFGLSHLRALSLLTLTSTSPLPFLFTFPFSSLPHLKVAMINRCLNAISISISIN